MFYRIVDRGVHRESTRYQLEARITNAGPFDVVGTFPSLELANYEATRHFQDYQRRTTPVIVSTFELT